MEPGMPVWVSGTETVAGMPVWVSGTETVARMPVWVSGIETTAVLPAPGSSIPTTEHSSQTDFYFYSYYTYSLFTSYFPPYLSTLAPKVRSLDF